MDHVTGVMIYYYFICKKKLWYFYKNLNMEQENELVKIGKLIDETSYSREKKNILIDNINVDFLNQWKVIHEVKKSRKIEKASIWQIKYYIYILRNKGIDIEKGILDYPLLKKREEVFLDNRDEEQMLI
ncbi:MAG: CRISPR-associated protein Cas4, partial [bacterium]